VIEKAREPRSTPPRIVAAYHDLRDVLIDAKRPKEAEAVYRQGILADPKRIRAD
jgi:hypothetical protein